MSEHTCEAMKRGDWRPFPCGKNAKYQRNGKWYCGVHDPERVKARDDKTRAKWRAETARNRMVGKLKTERDEMHETAVAFYATENPEYAERLSLVNAMIEKLVNADMGDPENQALVAGDDE